ncbi:SDR family NAD(P)-dependent oxidoreductase [Aeromicrobium sp. CFBP 8757]|uniref:SDR family NAD(P)-dependent oxidoreductase n=1 Tax=Aeromicrobium sp. CFBP 8757 TaxID=2775288 RepID=UPI0017867188|nr:SDR family NAD(P)-dependent oxidoreductase [Aeromicrobium sp. CFBP 8757]MBD8605468.1 SDR family NAD(P)-dependent oxidoreductase [Aeromicrobium sp. CFBP 8757]
MSINRTAVITGAGSGLGRDIALGLSAKGYRVFGTAISAEEIEELERSSDGAVTLARVDITDEESVRTWASTIAPQLPDGLGVLVNNAGILTPGPLEVIPMAAIRREFEVNVFGALSVTNAFLPSLREARGRLVQVSTMSVDFPVPFNGPSSASKAAFEAFSTIYRAELASFGIDVVVAVPGSMRTGGPAKTAAALDAVRASLTDEQRSLYGPSFEAFVAVLNAGQSGGMPSADAAAEIVELVEQTPVPRRVPVGEEAAAFLSYVAGTSPEDQDARRLSIITPTS